MARELHFEDSQKQAAMDALDLDAMQHEIKQMEATCRRLESPVVWSHNDLLSGNVMVTEQVRGWPGVGWLASPPQLWSHHDLHPHAMEGRGSTLTAWTGMAVLGGFLATLTILSSSMAVTRQTGGCDGCTCM